MTSFSTMSLYALTVKHPSATQDAISGDFLGNGKQQILTANGSRLAILEVSRRQKGFQELYSQDMFGIVRRIAKFRIAGGTKDHIVITTDSGRLVTYEYLPDEHAFKTVHFETYGKSGIRRVVPGEYLAADPKGRAIMLASTEKNKLVYILTRSGQTDIAISSPLEAHKPQTLVYCLIGLDVGYDNPMFASIEVDYSSSETDPSGEAYDEIKKEVVYYELDLGLNHIVRKWSEPIDRTANTLFRVPGGANAPSGVLVCGEDNITYRRIFNQKENVHRLAIPRREGPTEDPNRKRMIVAGTLYSLKGGDFFYLLQTEDGDVFKLTVEASNGKVEKIKIKYFDTIPVCTSICILRAGFVYAACESGDRILYELESLGDETEDPLFSSDQFPVDTDAKFAPPYFKPRALTNLTAVEQMPSLNPIMGMEVANPALEDAPQIYTINGTGGRSSFRSTRNALEVLDLIESPLPQNASDVWTTKLTSDDETDTLIVLCLHSRTLVLKIGDDVEEASNTGFLPDTNTLGVQQFGEDCIIQIHPKGIRHIQGIQFPDNDANATHQSLTDWQPPAHRTIVACATNNRQVAIALSSGQILYFECDSDGSLAMAEEEIALDSTINCLAMPDVPEGSVRAFFLAVGCSDQTVRIFNLSPDMEGNILRSISVQALTSPPSDLTINLMSDKSPRGYSQFLHIGLRSGVYIRSVLDEMTGDIGDTRRRFLGPEPIKFAKVTVAGEPAILAMTSRPWLGYTHPRTGVLQLTPLNYIAFKSAWNFDGSQFKGIICVSANELRIFTFNDLTDNTTYENIPLKYTPRKMVGYHEQGIFYIIESECNTLNADTRQNLIQKASKQDENGNGEATNGTEESDELPAVDFGYPRAQGRWASCIQAVDPVSEKAVTHTIELKTNQSLVSAALVFFESRGEDAFLAVGTAKDLSFTPYKYSGASIQIYKISPNGREFEFFHETEVGEPPLALLAFKGKLIAGVGRHLCLYDCGMKSVLRKAQAPNCVATRITDIKTQGSRLVVSDQAQSVTYVVHKDQVHPNRLIPFADDTVPRHTSASDMLDYETTVGGDKFGNIWLVRCPPKVSEASDESPDGSDLLVDKSFLGGTPNRLDLVAHYFANDIPVSIQKTVLLSGGERIIFWAGLQGTLGALIPFNSRRQHKMFQQLELQLRQDDKPLSGRDHLAYRSYFAPVKCVIDGDLIERFLVLSRDKRESIAGQMTGAEWTPSMIDEAIWNMRGLYAF
ncbi:similar to pre-mRNA splicing factor 3b [Plenodomus lingam JN3]|uniref:Similar to pre-mRNA splicing factor 3b n=1 Tax=Leptosphaeria maculans (strain JN3 / isolate v23.1.3 / race Av1-4-5-6-7-8) TaxID=985895 RepID=E5A750_LEPMJ|nr:similar to pre-mRNA splicing factor 3b [Plenodomus lingam JN3]CBX99445.1 similar to pre-mRNA splicing factor 3b [Plenodomus lingam JN3]